MSQDQDQEPRTIDLNGLIGGIWNSGEAWENLITLTDRLEHRFAGSAGERTAADYIRERFAAYGLKDVKQQEFEFQGWERGSTTLRLISPIEKQLDAIALPYSPAGKVHGELVFLEDGLETDFQNTDITDKIVMVTSATPGHHRRWLHRGEKYSLTVEGGAQAFVFMNHYPGLLPPTGSLRSNRIGEIPGIGISKEIGAYIARWLKDGPVEAVVNVEATAKPGTSRNVIGVLAPEANDVEIVIGAHYDGHDISQGALDNGTGVVVLMELARALAPSEAQLKRPVRFVAFGAEEVGLIGSRHYADGYDPERIGVMLNLDGPGRARDLRFRVHGFQELAELINKFSKEIRYPLEVIDEPAPFSDHWPFVARGIPACYVQPKTGDRGRGWGHTEADTLDKVDLRNIKENTMVLAQLVLKLARDPLEIPHKRPEEIERMVEETGLTRGISWL